MIPPESFGQSLDLKTRLLWAFFAASADVVGKTPLAEHPDATIATKPNIAAMERAFISEPPS